MKLADVKVYLKLTTDLKEVEEVNWMVRDVVMAADGLSASIDTFVDFTHNGEYVVEIKGFTAQTFTASVGDPETMVVYVGNAASNRQVTVGTTADLKYKLYDAKNVDVTDKVNSNLSSVDYEIVYSDGYTLNDTFLYFDEVGDYATVVATYHPGEKYDTNGAEVGVFKSAETKFVATPQNQASIEGVADWGITYPGSTNNKYVILDDDNEPDGKLWIKLKLSNGVITDPIDEYDEAIYVGETFIGYANFTALNPDVVEVYENFGNSNTFDVFGRTAGKSAPVMFSYVTNIAGEDVEIPVKALTIEVKAPRRMDKVGYGSTSITLSASPSDEHLDLDPNVNNNNIKEKGKIRVENPTISLSVKDQYGQDYLRYTILGWEPVSKLAERATMASYEYVDGDVQDDPLTPTFNETKLQHQQVVNMSNPANITVANRNFQPLLWDVNNDLHADGTQPAGNASVGYRVRIQDNETKAIMTAQFSINFRGHIGDEDHDDQRGHAIELILDKGNLDGNQGNAARFEGNAAAKAEKTLVFDVYEKCNQAYYDEVAFEAWTGTAVPTSAGLYYKVYKNGKDVTSLAKGDLVLSDNLNSGANGSGTTVTYRLSDVGGSDYTGAPGQIVIYKNANDTIGTGTYKFQLFEVKQSGNNFVPTSINGGMKTVNVQVNTGSYKITFRDSVKAATEDPADVIKCFRIADRNGNNFSLNGINTLDKANGVGTVNFNGTPRTFQIVRNFNKEYGQVNRVGDTIFVEKIVFWENVGGAYAEYVVPVNMFVEIGE